MYTANIILPAMGSLTLTTEVPNDTKFPCCLVRVRRAALRNNWKKDDCSHCGLLIVSIMMTAAKLPGFLFLDDTHGVLMYPPWTFSFWYVHATVKSGLLCSTICCWLALGVHWGGYGYLHPPPFNITPSHLSPISINRHTTRIKTCCILSLWQFIIVHY